MIVNLHIVWGMCQTGEEARKPGTVMGEDTPPTRKLINRIEAAKYISDNYYQVTGKTLANYATESKGPPYRLLGGVAHYTREDIDVWMRSGVHSRAPAAVNPIPFAKPQKDG